MVDKLKTRDQLLKELAKLREKSKNLEKDLNLKTKSEEQFRMISEESGDNISIVTFDLKAEYIYVSPSVKTVFGYEEEELIGKSFFDFIHPEDKKIILPLLKKYLTMKVKKLLQGKEKNISEVIEFRFKKKDGGWYHMQSKINFLGKNLLSVARDITKQKLIEMKLQESEFKFKELSDLAFEGILIHDKGVALDANLSLAKMFGYKKEELLGKNLIDFLIPEKYHGLIQTNIVKKRTSPYEVMGQKKNGSLFPIEVEAKAYVNEKNKILRVTAIRDLTERKRTEAIISHSVVVEAINAILKESLACETDVQVANACLTVAENLTNSKFGFIGELNESGRLNTLSISDPGWEECRMGENKTDLIIDDVEVRGIWGEAFAKGSSVIINNPDNHPSKVGVPAGHPQLTSFMGVLLRDREKIIGIIALGNKDGGYTQFDLERIESLSTPFVEALSKKRMDIELRNYQKDLESMVNERSENLQKLNNQLLLEINDRKKTEQSLRESEVHYRQLFNLLPYGGELISVKGNILDCSLSTAKMLGYDRDELIGENIKNFLDDDLLKGFKNDFPRLINGESVTIEGRMLHRDGSKIDVLRAAEPIFNQNREVEGIIALSIDVTKRKMVEEKLKRSEKEYRELFDDSSDAIYIQDENGLFLDVNQGVVNMYGYPKDFYIGKTPEILSAPGKNDLDYVVNCIKEAFDGIPQQFDFWGIRKNGEIFPKIVRCKSGFYMGKKALIVFAIDITDRFNAEKERATLEEQLQHAQKMEAIGALAGGIAHDFNNILGAIIGYTDLTLNNPFDGKKVTKYMKNVLKASIRAKEMVKQILSFSRKNKSLLTKVYISKIINETIEFLKSSLPVTIKLETDIEPDLNPILADSTQINQVLMNLCTNSAHAMKKDGGIITIGVNCVQLDKGHSVVGLEPGGYQLLKVQDTGTGINEDLLGKIFEPYFTTKSVGEGTGMGLAVVYGIIKDYGGEIKVSSETGKGTRFDIYLPTTQVVTQKIVDAKDTPVLEGKAERILFVDDEALIVDMSNDLLSDFGYKVDGYTDSIKALEVFKSEPDMYDLLITDMTMPNMTGVKLTEEIHKIKPDLPVIVCTGFSDHINDDNFRSMGANALVMKPVVIKDLLGIIRDILDSKKKFEAK